MNENRSTAGDALISLLKSSINADGGQPYGHLVLYTSFGVVRGRMGYASAQQLLNEKANSQNSFHHEVIELNDASVEHYSNHLPTATFGHFYVSLSDVNGFALLEM